jgi:RimJ/RimL family protein N-acetyltransferase
MKAGRGAMLFDAEQLPTISTPRLRLRWITPDDVPALYEIFGDPVVCRYWSRPPLRNLADAVELQREITSYFRERSLFQWGITGVRDDRVIGTCTLASLTAEHRRAEVGFALARAAWGRGYMAEALPALIRFAFEVLELHRLEADVDPRNQRSIDLLERVGFRREGLMRQRYHLNDELQDALFYGLLRDEFQHARGLK